MGSQDKDGKRKEERIGPKKKEMHGLLYTKIVKSGTIRLVSGCTHCTEIPSENIFLNPASLHIQLSKGRK